MRSGPFPGGMRYNAYGPFLRDKFGCRVYKVIVDAGFTCPNRDGTVARGGCTYCNNESFRPKSVNGLLSVGEQIRGGMEFLRRRYRARKFIVYFQPFSNTHAPLQVLVPLYEEALAQPDVIGLSLGTRPDCVDSAKIAWLAELARTSFVTIEYGLESIYDETLKRINRGHDYACWLHAVSETRGRAIWICAHVILGFPWETREQMLGMADAISRAGVDFLKIHHLHVVRHTILGRDYVRSPFKLLDYDEYRDLVVDFLERLDPAIRIQRLFGLAPEEQLLGPNWGKSKAEIQRGIEQKLEERNTYQGKRFA